MRLFRPSNWRRLCAAILLLAAGFSVSARAAIFDADDDENEAPFDITADSIEYESERNVYIARGNVLITQPGRSLTADWVTFSSVTRQGVATGNVIFTEKEDILYADVLSFEIDRLKGIVFEGFLDSRDSGFKMTGETIRRTGEETYIFDEGTFTTCRCPREEDKNPWQIRAEKADIEVGGYATVRNSSIDILGFPVLWTPWMRYPIKTERETGFLLPTYTFTGQSGTEVGLPFFWAARHNVNVTLTASYLLQRGFKPSIGVEYVFGERSEGELYGTIIEDQDVGDDPLETPFDSTRWAGEWIHDQFLPRGWRAKVDARLFSDNLYAFDFNDFREFKRHRFLESRAFVEKRFGPLQRYGVSGGVWWADDLQNPDDQDRDDFLLQRLPHLQLAGMPQALPGLAERLVASFDVDYTHFYSRKRAGSVYPAATVVGDDQFLDTGIDAIPNGEERNEDGNIVTLDDNVIMPDGRVLTAEDYLAELPPDADVVLPDGRVLTAGDYLAELPTDAETPLLSADGSRDDYPPGPENDGKFQEGEPLADRGHRLVLNPRIGLPFRIADVVEVLPELGYHGTFYHTDGQSSAHRSLFTAMLDTRVRLRRSMELPFGLGSAVHLMEPRLVYTGVTNASQRDNPLFVPRPWPEQQRIRQFELYNVTRNPSDRVDSVNAVTVGLGNRFYVPGEEGEPPRLFADISLSTQYEIGNDDLRNLYLEGTVYPWENIQVRFNMGYDLEETGFSEGLLEARYSDEKGYDLAFSYRYLRDIPRFFESFEFVEGDENRYDEFETGFQRINQIALRGRLPVTRNWALSYRLRYSFETGILLTNRAGVEYISKCRCWAVMVELGEDRSGGVDFNVRYALIGLGNDDIRPFAGGRSRGTRDPQGGARY